MAAFVAHAEVADSGAIVGNNVVGAEFRAFFWGGVAGAAAIDYLQLVFGEFDTLFLRQAQKLFGAPAAFGFSDLFFGQAF